MTRKDIVGLIADGYADGVCMAIRGEMVNLNLLKGLISETYMKAFEDGIVFKTWDEFSSQMYNIKTDAEFYKMYAESNVDNIIDIK